MTPDEACWRSAAVLGGLERHTKPASLNGCSKSTHDGSCAGAGALHSSCAGTAQGSLACADAGAVLTAPLNSLGVPESDLVAQLQQLLLAKQVLQSAKDVALGAFDQDGFWQLAAQLQDEAQVVLLFEVRSLC